MATLPLDPETERAARSLLTGALALRSRLFRAVLAWLVLFLGLLPFANDVFTLVAGPMIEAMPQGSTLITKQVASPFMTPLRATFWVSLFLAMPIMLYQLWQLIDYWLPAAKKRIAPRFIVASAGLFYGGAAFAFFVVLPMVFAFFTSVAPEGVKVMTDINAFLGFTIGIVFAFGLAFQVPVAIVVLVWTGLVSQKALRNARPYVLLACFIIGMLLTPPDVFSQTLLAVPMYTLYEIALLVCRRFLPER